MNISLIAYKCGMTRYFFDNGLSIPVTIVKIFDNYVLEIKEINNSTCLIKIASILSKDKNKSLVEFYKKINVPVLKKILVFQTSKNNINNYTVSRKINFNIIENFDKIDVTGISKGKGFTGVIKRHNFKSQKASHGNSLSHRAPGSIGQCQTPGKVFKGKKMAGRMGCFNVTKLNIKIIKFYKDLNVLVLKGCLPGFSGNKIILRKKF